MQVEVTNVRSVSTDRGPQCVVQFMFRTDRGVNVCEQWMKPSEAPVNGHYKASVELYATRQGKLGASFTNLEKLAVKAAPAA